MFLTSSLFISLFTRELTRNLTRFLAGTIISWPVWWFFAFRVGVRHTWALKIPCRTTFSPFCQLIFISARNLLISEEICDFSHFFINSNKWTSNCFSLMLRRVRGFWRAFFTSLIIFLTSFDSSGICFANLVIIVSLLAMFSFSPFICFNFTG